jgi:ABC-2 type transport system permease protein
MKYGRYGWESLAIAQRILVELGRQKRQLLVWIVFPVLVLFGNGYLLAQQMQISLADALAIAAPATLVGVGLFFSSFWGSMQTIAAERSQHTLQRLLISPLSPMSYCLGVFIAYSCVGVGQTLLIYTLAFLGGARLGSPGLSLLIILLAIAAYIGAGFAIGTRSRIATAVSIPVLIVGILLLCLGGGLLPTLLLPDMLLRAAIVNPIYHMSTALTGVSAIGLGIAEIAPNLGVLVGLAGLMVGVGWWSYYRLVRLEGRL